MSDPYPAADHSTPSAKPSRPRLLDRLLSLVRREPEDREGIMAVLDAARERELIDADAYSMLKGALAVSEQTAVDVMVPRARMDLLDVSQPIATLMPEIIETAHSRFSRVRRFPREHHRRGHDQGFVASSAQHRTDFT